MSAPIVKSFVLFLLLGLITEGLCACSLSKVDVGTFRTGRVFSGKPEWQVIVTNNCQCAQQMIYLSCKDFKTTEPVSPLYFKPEGNRCLINGGNALVPGASMSFNYAWDPPHFLVPVSAVTSGC